MQPEAVAVADALQTIQQTGNMANRALCDAAMWRRCGGVAMAQRAEMGR